MNCALLENDKPLTRKYIGVLKQTLFYSNWAKQVETLLEQPDLIAKDPEREPITHMLHYDNVLTGDQGYTERFLMRQLTWSSYKDDPIFQEQCLLSTLWTKDINRFWYHFSNYAKLHPKEPMPRFYQEAAYLYTMIEDRKGFNNMPFDANIKNSFERFATSVSEYDGQDETIAREALYLFFWDTYYYDYYTMSHLPEY